LFYLAIGLTGYFSTFDKTGVIVIDRDPLKGSVGNLGGSTLLMLAGMIMIIFVLCFAYPLNFIPLRSMIVYKMYKTHKYSTTQ
jgi:hypothetical protein